MMTDDREPKAWIVILIFLFIVLSLFFGTKIIVESDVVNFIAYKLNHLCDEYNEFKGG